MERACCCKDALRYQNRYKHPLAHRRNQILSTCGPGLHTYLGIFCRHSFIERLSCSHNTLLCLWIPCCCSSDHVVPVFSSTEHNRAGSFITLPLPCLFNSDRPRTSAGKAPLSRWQLSTHLPVPLPCDRPFERKTMGGKRKSTEVLV